MLPLVTLLPAMVALTVVVPRPTALITPLLLTVSTLVLPLTQFVASAVASKLLEPVWRSCTVTTACSVSVRTMDDPATKLAEVGVKLVMITPDPAAILAEIYRWETAPFHIRNSSTVPLKG